MRKRILYPVMGVMALVGTLLGGTAVQAEEHEHATFGECISAMARSGPNEHAAAMGLKNYGEVVLHCQEMHDPPAAR